MFLQTATLETAKKPSQVVLNFGSKYPSLLLDLQTRMILGRAGLNTEEFIVDLTLFNAFELGVSRKHALLYINQGHVFVEDLGSDEGTHLNDRLLIPFTPYLVPNAAILKLGRLPIKLWSDFTIPVVRQ